MVMFNIRVHCGGVSHTLENVKHNKYKFLDLYSDLEKHVLPKLEYLATDLTAELQNSGGIMKITCDEDVKVMFESNMHYKEVELHVDCAQAIPLAIIDGEAGLRGKKRVFMDDDDLYVPPTRKKANDEEELPLWKESAQLASPIHVAQNEVNGHETQTSRGEGSAARGGRGRGSRGRGGTSRKGRRERGK